MSVQKRGFLILVLFILVAGSVSATQLFSENFGSGTNWVTTVPGWIQSSGATGRDDQFSRSGGSDSNYYAWLDSNSATIEYDSISLTGYHDIYLTYYYNLFGSFNTSEFLVAEWKEHSSSTWNLIAKTTNIPGWNTLGWFVSGSENKVIDLRFRSDGVSSGKFIFLDDVSITGDLLTLCGNGAIDGNEQCDNGINNNNNGSCKLDCTLHVCGDGFIWTGHEQCDDGNAINTDTCDNNCNLIVQLPVCGNGICESGETCGNCSLDCGCSGGQICCSNSCTTATCSSNLNCNDGFACTTDTCNNPGTCTASCSHISLTQCVNSDGCCPAGCNSSNDNDCTAVCGNGKIESGEQCDNGTSNSNSGQCSLSCTLTYCGDSIMQNPDGLRILEQCDDGNFNNYDACTDTCKNAVCGDGYVYPALEQCDDGNTVSGDGCSSTCKIEGIGQCFAPVDVMLIIDRSSSMNDLDSGVTKIVNAKSAATSFINQMNFSIDTAGLTSFNESATLDQAMTSNNTLVSNAINSLFANIRFAQTNIGDGIKVARQEILANSTHSKVMILLSDGAPNAMTLANGSLGYCYIDPSNQTDCTLYAWNQSNISKQTNITIFTIGLGVTNFTQDLLKNIATDANHTFFAANSSVLQSIYNQIAGEICPCGNGVLDPGEQCDDGNSNNYDNCTNQCKLNVCGDNFVNVGVEQCELPKTANNVNCLQTTFTCQGAKAGTRDNLGNCSASCGCNNDPFTFACVKGSCGANCSVNADCDDNNASTKDFCITDDCSCHHSFCGDGIVDIGEECDNGNQNNNASTCNTQCKKTYCGDIFVQIPNGVGTGGPLNNGFEDCDDGNLLNTDNCLNNCTAPKCGDGVIWAGHEQCELPNSQNNANCPQTQTADCNNNHKQGTRDSLGNCTAACGCVSDPFTNYVCVKRACGAICSSDSDCSQSISTCQGGGVNKTGLRDAFGTCDGTCQCIPDPFTYQCVKGSCGGICAIDTDCDDHNASTIDTCSRDGCNCLYTPWTQIGDSKVSQSMPTSNFGLGQYMLVNPKSNAIDRSYIRIDVSSLLGHHLTAANLSLAVFYTGSNAANKKIQAWYCPNHDFVETNINWNNQPFDSQCTLTYIFTIPNNVVAGSPVTWHSFNLTNVTNQELSTGDGKFTIVLRSADEGTVFDNSEYVEYITMQYGEAAYRPQFITA